MANIGKHQSKTSLTQTLSVKGPNNKGLSNKVLTTAKMKVLTEFRALTSAAARTTENP